MAYNPKRSLSWLGLTLVGGVVAGIGTAASRPVSGVLIIIGVLVGLGGILGARWNTDWYDFDKRRRERGR
ncbi:MAG TPA: hypothetical protein VFK56_17905 [Mycobacterium sp.]|nr:hypothetical protein [Mycobacterium sp.]